MSTLCFYKVYHAQRYYDTQHSILFTGRVKVTDNYKDANLLLSKPNCSSKHTLYIDLENKKCIKCLNYGIQNDHNMGPLYILVYYIYI